MADCKNQNDRHQKSRKNGGIKVWTAIQLFDILSCPNDKMPVGFILTGTLSLNELTIQQLLFFVSFKHPLDVLPYNIKFQVDLIPYLQLVKIGMFKSVRNDRH